MTRVVLMVIAFLWAMNLPAMAADAGVEAAVDRTTVPIDGQVVYSITVAGGMRQLPSSFFNCR